MNTEICALNSCENSFAKTNWKRIYCGTSCKQKAFFQRNSREKYARANRLRRFRLTVPQFEDMLAIQDHKCLICEKPADQESRSLSVDHDHRCCPGRDSCGLCVRGLLCGTCNTSLGGFGDDVRVLYKAIEYLESWNK